MTVIFEGERGVSTYVAIAVKSGLKLYAKHRIRPNAAWTPTAMMRKASEITGESFKPRDYLGAVHALEKWISINGAAR